MRKILVYLPFLLLSICACSSNEDENLLPEEKSNAQFFEHAETNDEFKEFVIDYLKTKDDSIPFTAKFVRTYGTPKWDITQSYGDKNTISLIVPISYNENSISSLYYFVLKDSHFDYYLLMNDENDIAYEQSKGIIAYFEKLLCLQPSNPNLFVKLPDNKRDSSSQLKTYRTETEVCWYYFGGTTADPYMYYQGSTCSSSVSYDFDDNRGDWSANSAGSGSVTETPTPANGGGGTGDPKDPDPKPAPPVKTTQEFLDNEKLNCIWGKLNNIVVNQNNSLITSIFANFPGLAYNPQDINIEIATNLLTKDGGVANGTTEWENGNFTIKINKDNLDSKAPIEIFRTIIHEMIHAHLWRLQYVNTDSFISRYRKYIEFKDGVCVTDQHILMKDYYIPMLSNALKAYDTLNGRTLDSSYYTNLAWAGLHMSLPLSERVKIANTIDFFRNRNLICDE